MPITAQYSWKEKSESLKISIPTKGVSPAKIDIHVTQSTLKVNMTPYLVDILLRHHVDPIKHKANVINGVLHITLFKTTPERWGELEMDSESADMSREIKRESQQKQEELEKELGEKRKDKRIENERFALRKQMGIDEAERSRLESMKAEEKKEAESEVYRTFAQLEAAEADKASKKKSTSKSVHFPSSALPAQAQAEVKSTLAAAKAAKTLSSTGKPVPPAAPSSRFIFEDADVSDFTVEAEGDDPASGSSSSSSSSSSAATSKSTPGAGAGVSAPSSSRFIFDDADVDDFSADVEFDDDIDDETGAAGQGSPSRARDGTHRDADIDEEDENEDEEGDEEGEDKIAVVAEAKHLFTTRGQQLPGDDAEEADDEEVKYIPAPRTQGVSTTEGAKISISFTPRVFPTPMRESKAAEEEDWVAKNRRHLKKHGVLGKSAGKGARGDVSEEDPVWLKAKGDDFFRLGDFMSAINAYSAAVDVDPTAVACFSNRAACYLKQNMAYDCIADCSTAISLLQIDKTEADLDKLIADAIDPAQAAAALESNLDPTTRRQVAKLLIRRGAAHCLVGKFNEAESDYQTSLRHFQLLLTQSEAAIPRQDSSSDSSSSSSSGSSSQAPPSPLISALKTEISSLTADVNRVQLLKRVDAMKLEADVAFSERRLQDALEKYNSAIALLPVHVGCLSNRSACRIALGDVSGCVEDCSVALSLLEIDVSNLSSDSAATAVAAASPVLLNGSKSLAGHANALILSSILPAVGSDKRKSWVLKTVTRRGAAHFQLGKIDEAIVDYGLAAGLDPRNESLRVDLNKLINFKSGATQRVTQQQQSDGLPQNPLVGKEGEGEGRE